MIVRRLLPLILVALVTVACTGASFGIKAIYDALKPEPTAWLVVLEHNWEDGLSRRDFSEGEILKAFFAKEKKVEVRCRFFTDARSLRQWCSEIQSLPGPVYVVFSDHGSIDGLYSAEDTIGYQAIAATLRGATNVKLVHFAACSVMRGVFQYQLSIALGRRNPICISGFASDVDWSQSSVADLLYLDLILSEHLSPTQAWRQLLLLMPIAGSTVIPGCDSDPLCFRVFDPAEAWSLVPWLTVPQGTPQ